MIQKKPQGELNPDDNFKDCIIARSKWGKTIVMLEHVKELIKERKFTPERVVLFSKSIKSDKPQVEFVNWMKHTYKANFDKMNTSAVIQMEFINDLFNQQEKLKIKIREMESDKKTKKGSIPHLYQYLLIFDDQISENILSDGQLNEMFTRGRQFNINMIFLLQYFKANLPPTCREQFTSILLGSMNSVAVLEELLMFFSQGADDGGMLTKKQALMRMKEFYGIAIRSRNGHGFLNIHTEVQFGEGRLEQNYDGIFFDQQNGYDESSSESDDDDIRKLQVQQPQRRWQEETKEPERKGRRIQPKRK